ncbi:MAG: ABC transporter ATP-binding protein, partial [Brachybacterium sp.]|nr:ABC transporter ATP-binding protein [Brachybacterium sp.]
DEFGQTVVMVTHERDAAERADRILSLADGRIASDEHLRGQR